MSTLTSQEKKTGLKSWTTRDLLVTAVIGIVFGLIVAGAMNWSLILQAATTPLLGIALSNSVFVMAGMTAPYIVRRPGAAIISELITGIVMSPFTVFGFMTIMGRLMEGVVYELPFLVTRYRRYGWLPMTLGGIFGGTAFFIMSFPIYSAQNLGTGLVIGLVLINMTSCAVGVALARQISNTIAKTGALNGFAIGKELQEEI